MGARRAEGALGFFLANRQLPPWPHIAAATATGFAGWLFIGEPALILRDGFQAGYLSFAAVTLPLVGAFFMKRQWALGRRFGYVTPGEMFADYLRGDLVRVFTVVVAVLFAVPFLGLALGSAGRLVSIGTGGALTRDFAMWGIAAVLLIYVSMGGIRAVAHVASLQVVLISVGTIILGLAVYDLVGGFAAMNGALARIAESTVGTWGTTRGYGGGDFNGLFATPGVVQWTAGLGREAPLGGPWTGLMALTFLLALSGIQLSPAFSMWAFASRDTRAFAPQQVWASAAGFGLLLFVFVPLQGIGGLLLGGSTPVAEAKLAIAEALPRLTGGEEGLLVASLVNLLGAAIPWLAGLATVCGIAVITAGAGALLTTLGAVLTRDLYMRFFNPRLGGRQQIVFARVSMLIGIALAVLMATFAKGSMSVFGSLALALAVQLLPALLAVNWIPWFTRQGVNAGLLVGGVVAVLTDPLGQALTGGALPWGYWPWTIHAAGWGLAANLSVCVLGSAITQSPEEGARRAAFHAFLRDHVSVPVARRGVRSFAWVATMVWVFFGIGPGIVLGNRFFGAPGDGLDGWHFSMPSIWAWQILWWGLGVLLVWFLAYRLALSTAPEKTIVPVTDDVATALPGIAGRPA